MSDFSSSLNMAGLLLVAKQLAEFDMKEIPVAWRDFDADRYDLHSLESARSTPATHLGCRITSALGGSLGSGKHYGW
ncbi:unnamed protein product, partial [Mesorhabditis belari]|uniref:Uncharacterized protein n=1 Tax=Mesorhabditis belari TaxID=2138241 RepID=A0AAF3FA41_9BILA